MYSPQLLDHFEHPRNSGELHDADARVQVENPACGDILELAVKLEDGCIDALCFRAKGCVPTIACASAMTELVKNKSLPEARAIRKVDIEQAVGGLPATSGHAAQLALDALRTILEKLG